MNFLPHIAISGSLAVCGMSRTTFSRLLKKLGIDTYAEFKSMKKVMVQGIAWNWISINPSKVVPCLMHFTGCHLQDTAQSVILISKQPT